MARPFDVVYDDFAGGYYVGPSYANQPRNTFHGDNIMATADEALLMPAAELLPASSAFSTSSSGRIVRGTVDSAGRVVTVDRLSSGNTTLHWFDVSAFPATTPFSTTTAAATTYVDDNAEQRSPLVAFGNNFYYYVGHKDNAGATAAQISQHDATGITFVDTPLPAGAHPICVAHDQFLCVFPRTLSSIRNRFYYSAPGNGASWDSNNYYNIGNPNYPIRAMVSRGTELYIGKPDGWWLLTGVLGQTASIRKIAHRGPTSAVVPIVSNLGIMYPATEVAEPFGTAALRLLRGSQVEPMLYWPYPRPDGIVSTHVVELVRVGDHIIMDGQDGMSVFVFNEPRQRWRRLLRPTDISTSCVNYFTPAETPSLSRYAYFVRTQDKAVGTADARIYRHELEPVEPPVTSTNTFTSGTASLAQYVHRSPFVINNVLIELNLGYTSTQSERSIGISLSTTGAALDGGNTSLTQFANRTSATQTAILPLTTNTNRESVWYRFAPNDGGHTMAVTPNLTLKGVKVARVILRCSEV